MAFYRDADRSSFTGPVSVIICARNELKNLRENLPLFLDQDYPEYQVVVVNDCSWDESEKMLEEMAKEYPRLKVVTIAEQEKYRHGKKFALSLGIKGAAHEHLLLTDADCQPCSRLWIRKMASGFEQNNQIVLGYGAYRRTPGLLDKFIRTDTVFTAIQYMSAAIAGKPYMGVGRNLGYTKTLFFKNKGFASHNHIMSGDDDLFVNQASNSSNTTVELRTDSFTLSKPRPSFMSWMQQKKRHMSTGIHYRTGNKMTLGLFFLSLIIFYLSLAGVFFFPLLIIPVAAGFGVRLLLQLLIFGKCMKKLGELDLLWMVPLFDLFAALLYPLLSLSNLIFKDKTWK